MKTAQEWIASGDAHFDKDCEGCVRIIEEIQLDALGTAMKICENYVESTFGQEFPSEDPVARTAVLIHRLILDAARGSIVGPDVKRESA